MAVREQVKTTILLAYPVMLSQLGQVAVGVADSMMVGRLGALELAASSLANSIFFCDPHVWNRDINGADPFGFQVLWQRKNPSNL
jgi:hypothetical protein